MKITVIGQTIESFKIRIEDSSKRIEEFDINSLLVIDDQDLSDEIENCAATEHFWNQVALESERELEEFEKITYAQFKAHTEKYARYYLKGLGEKTQTGAAKENSAILLFSKDTDIQTNAQIAYKGYKEDASKVGMNSMPLDDFEKMMYIYDASFEDVEAQLLALKHKANQLKAVSSAFNTKSWSVKTRAADKRALANI